MNPFNQLLQALSSIGQGTPQSAQALQQQQAADTQLNRMGSLMGSQRQGQLQGQQSPLAATAAQLVNALNPIDWMGGMGAEGSLAHVPATFRNIGLQRVQGTPDLGRGPLNPAEYLQQIQAQPNYERFKQLIQMFTRKGLGEEFPVYRGAPTIDPLLQQPLTHGTLPTVTAGSLDPRIAQEFALWNAKAYPGGTQVARMTATPESVVGLLPRRGAKYASEAEMILNPQLTKDIALQAGVKAPLELTPPDKGLESLLLEALQRSRPPSP